MDADTYWKTLVNRVFIGNEVLEGDEDVFYRLSCIFSETLEGIECYFERRYEEFEKDMVVLNSCGFANIVSDFEEVRLAMFGDYPMTEKIVGPVIKMLVERPPEAAPILERIHVIQLKLLKKLEFLPEFRYEFGIKAGFYRRDD